MKPSIEKIKRRFYRNPLNVDDVFFQTLKNNTNEESSVVDIGAGKGERFHFSLKGNVKKITGVDSDKEVKENPNLDEYHIGDIYNMPFIYNNSVDCAYSRYVLEHIEFPERLLREINRILRFKGLFIFLTPNRWHYVPIISSLTPDSFHKWLNKKRGREEVDTFQTFYRMNSGSVLRKLAKRNGFIVRHLYMFECDPKYLTFNRPLYYLGIGYERIVNNLSIFYNLRVNILGIMEKI